MADVPFSDFGGSGIKQIIRSSGTVTVTGSGTFTQTVTIVSVNTAKSLLSLLTSVGYVVDSTGNDGVLSVSVDLTNSTTVTISVLSPSGGNTVTFPVSFQVAEYY